MGLLNSLYDLRNHPRHHAVLINDNNQIQLNENQDICRRYPGFLSYAVNAVIISLLPEQC